MQQTIQIHFVRFLFLCVALVAGPGFSSGAWAQLLTEDFPTSGSLTANGWSQLSTVATNPVTTSSQNLTYAGLTTAGNSASLTTSGQDVSRGFTAQTGGFLYSSCLISVATAQNTGDYFIHFANTTTGTSGFYSRVFIKNVTGGFQLGIAKNSTTPVYAPTMYSFGITYFVVFKYTYNSGSTADDLSSLFVSPVLGGTEPTTPAATDAGGSDASSLAAINLRQGGVTAAAGLLVDYIRVGTTWADVASANAPTLTANPTTLSGFVATQGQVSAPQVYTLTGSNLTADASVSASAGFEVSTDGSTYATNATVPQTSSAISQTLAVRLSNMALVGAVSGTITNVSGSATATVNVTGNVTAPTPGKIVISQVYGGAGCGTVNCSTYKNDYIELFNSGGTAVNVNGWSVQYGSATGNFTGVTNLPNVSIPAGGYLLIQEGGNANGVNNLPTADVVGNIAMSATAAKVALVNSTGTLSGTCASGATVIDLVGYGTTTCFEGSSAAPAPSTTNAVFRASNGCTDTDNNGTDFATAVAAPRNSATAANLCPPPTTPLIVAMPSPVSLSYTVGSGPASQVITVNASNLNPAVGTLTVSSSSTAVTVAPATVSYTGGVVSGATITAQLVSGLAIGTYSATLTLTNGTTSTTLSVIGTVTNAPGAPTLISTIQGSGTTAALTGTQTIEGIVTRVFTGTAALNGFYVQEEDSDRDSNPVTSEGIAVFDPNGVFTGSQGDKVRITGPVAEFTSASSSLTQMTLSATANFTVVSVNNALPAVATVTLPVTNRADLERYEGMLVQVQAATGNLTVTDNFGLGRFGQVILAATDPATNQPGTDPRIEQYTQFNLPNVAGNAAYQAAIAKRLIILDDASGVQNPPQIIHARGGNPLSGTNTLRAGDDIASLTGILDERFEGYRIQTNVGVNFNPANPRLNAPVAVGGTLKVMGLNVLNYFTDFDTNPGSNNGPIVTPPNGGGVSFEPRGAETADEFTRQRDKIIAAITAASPDVLGIIEMENNGATAIGNLVDGLNAISGAGTYSFVDDANLINDPNPATGAVGTDAIKVGLIYKPASVSAVGLPMSSNNAVFDRPPVAQTFLERNTGAKFSVIVNHFKSKGSGSGANADQNDGQGASNADRVAQANALISFVPSVTAAAGDPDVLMLGDYNAYALEDPIRALATAGFASVRPNDDYSYAFGGQFGFLDYAFTNTSLATQVSGSTDWHINSDEPLILDYNTNFKQNQPANLYNADPFRASDHDAVVVGLSLTPSVSATLVASTSVCAGSPANFSLTVAGLGTGETYSYTISNGTNSTTAAGVSASAVQTSVVPTVAGSFTATVLTLTNASTTAASGTVTINALPTNASLTSGTLTCTNTSVTLTASATGGTSYTFSAGAVQIGATNQAVVSAAGDYSIIISNASGCTVAATATVVSSTAAPTNASLTAGTLTCTNTSATLTASATGGTSYTLSGGAGTQTNSSGSFVVSTPGDYTVTTSGANGCTATATATVVSNTATPMASLSASSTTACSPASITLTAGGGTSYTFSAGAMQIGSTNQAIVTQSGNYSVTVSNASGCTATASTSVTVSQPPAAPTLTGVSRTVNASTTPLPLIQFVSATGSNTLSFSGVNGALNPPTANISQAGVQSFSVTQTNANGCVSPPTLFTITVVTTPTTQSVCRSSTVVLNAVTAGVRYEWYKNGTTAPFKLTEIASIQKGTATSSLTLVSIQTSAPHYVKVFQADGSFTFDGPFTVTVNYGCTAPGARVAATEVSEVRLTVMLTPNPVVDGQLTAVVRGAGGQALSVELVDVRGQVVRQQNWPAADDAQPVEWSIGNQSSGLYLMRAKAGSQTTTIKVIKQ